MWQTKTGNGANFKEAKGFLAAKHEAKDFYRQEGVQSLRRHIKDLIFNLKRMLIH